MNCNFETLVVKNSLRNTCTKLPSHLQVWLGGKPIPKKNQVQSQVAASSKSAW